MNLSFEPLTPARWPDLEAVFGAKGCPIARQCWCMAYRMRPRHPRPIDFGRRGTTAAPQPISVHSLCGIDGFSGSIRNLRAPCVGASR